MKKLIITICAIVFAIEAQAQNPILDKRDIHLNDKTYERGIGCDYKGNPISITIHEKTSHKNFWNIEGRLRKEFEERYKGPRDPYLMSGVIQYSIHMLNSDDDIKNTIKRFFTTEQLKKMTDESITLSVYLESDEKLLCYDLHIYPYNSDLVQMSDAKLVELYEALYKTLKIVAPKTKKVPYYNLDLDITYLKKVLTDEPLITNPDLYKSPTQRGYDKPVEY